MMLSGKLVASIEGLRVSWLRIWEERLGVFCLWSIARTYCQSLKASASTKNQARVLQKLMTCACQENLLICMISFQALLKGMWPEGHFLLFCAMFPSWSYSSCWYVMISKPFLNSPTGTGLKPAWGLCPWVVLWVTYSLLALHFPFAFPEVQPQAAFLRWVVAAAVGLFPSAQRAPHNQGFPLRSHSSFPKASKRYGRLWHWLQTSATVSEACFCYFQCCSSIICMGVCVYLVYPFAIASESL